MLDLTAIKARRALMDKSMFGAYDVVRCASRDIDALIAEVERLQKVIPLALEYAYQEGENYNICNGCTSDGSMHRDRCPVAAIEKLVSEENH